MHSCDSVVGVCSLCLEFSPAAVEEMKNFKGALTTVGIRIYTKLKIIRPDIYKSNSL